VSVSDWFSFEGSWSLGSIAAQDIKPSTGHNSYPRTPSEATGMPLKARFGRAVQPLLARRNGGNDRHTFTHSHSSSSASPHTNSHPYSKQARPPLSLPRESCRRYRCPHHYYQLQRHNARAVPARARSLSCSWPSSPTSPPSSSPLRRRVRVAIPRPSPCGGQRCAEERIVGLLSCFFLYSRIWGSNDAYSSSSSSTYHHHDEPSSP